MPSLVAANASTFSSSFTVDVGDETLDALPLGWGRSGIAGLFQRFNTTIYDIFDAKGARMSTVAYDGKRDSITIRKADGVNVVTTTTLFRPHRFVYGETEYSVAEAVTGALAIYRGGSRVAKGKCSFRHVVIYEYPEELAPILPELATGFLIKMVLWSFFV